MNLPHTDITWFKPTSTLSICQCLLLALATIHLTIVIRHISPLLISFSTFYSKPATLSDCIQSITHLILFSDFVYNYTLLILLHCNSTIEEMSSFYVKVHYLVVSTSNTNNVIHHEGVVPFTSETIWLMRIYLLVTVCVLFSAQQFASVFSYFQFKEQSKSNYWRNALSFVNFLEISRIETSAYMENLSVQVIGILTPTRI